jgi:hypothetical protein
MAKALPAVFPAALTVGDQKERQALESIITNQHPAGAGWLQHGGDVIGDTIGSINRKITAEKEALHSLGAEITTDPEGNPSVNVSPVITPISSSEMARYTGGFFVPQVSSRPIPLTRDEYNVRMRQASSALDHIKSLQNDANHLLLSQQRAQAILAQPQVQMPGPAPMIVPPTNQPYYQPPYSDAQPYDDADAILQQ